MPAGLLQALAALHFVAGIAGSMVVGALTTPCDRYGCGLNSNAPLSSASIVALCLWVGPYAVALCGGLVGGLLWWAWSCRPRRVLEYSPDMRAVYRSDDDP